MKDKLDILETVGHVVKIYIAGDLTAIKNACREFVLRGLCVSIAQNDFVFTGGMESGACITLINYARYPKTLEEIEEIARDLAKFLIEKCFQESASIVTPIKSIWLSRR